MECSTMGTMEASKCSHIINSFLFMEVSCKGSVVNLKGFVFLKSFQASIYASRKDIFQKPLCYHLSSCHSHLFCPSILQKAGCHSSNLFCLHIGLWRQYWLVAITRHIYSGPEHEPMGRQRVSLCVCMNVLVWQFLKGFTNSISLNQNIT